MSCDYFFVAFAKFRNLSILISWTPPCFNVVFPRYCHLFLACSGHSMSTWIAVSSSPHSYSGLSSRFICAVFPISVSNCYLVNVLIWILLITPVIQKSFQEAVCCRHMRGWTMSWLIDWAYSCILAWFCYVWCTLLRVENKKFTWKNSGFFSSHVSIISAFDRLLSVSPVLVLHYSLFLGLLPAFPSSCSSLSMGGSLMRILTPVDDISLVNH